MAAGTGLVGSVVLHYRIIERLGAGGMGEVYLAEDTRLGRQVALKFLSASIGSDTEARQRLVREAQAAAVLRSPHIAVTYDLVEHDGALFIAMEYVQGELLSERIARGPLAVGEALDIALQLADALDEAHGHGIVHRDIKSANLILTSRSLLKVLDFGLAKFVQTPDAEGVRTMANMTLAGSILGTLNYMAPEQLTGAPLDHRADLFSSGVVIYEMLAGRLPFHGSTPAEIADHILNRPPDAIGRYNYSVTADVEAILLKALEKNPDFRYQSARDLYIDLFNARRRLSSNESHRASSSWGGAMDFADAASPLPIPPPAPRKAAAAPVAVINFTNITGVAADDWIGQGMAESVTADLARIKSIAVVPREQIFELQRNLSEMGRRIDDRQAMDIARRLRASVVVSGAYQRLGDRIRITSQAVDVGSGRPLTTVKVDGRVDELFDLQDRVVTELARGLAGEVEQRDRAAIRMAGTHSIEAFQAFSRGMLNLRLADRDSMDRGIALLEQALEHDPLYVEAMVELAGALELKAAFQAVPALLGKSLELAERALEIRPDDADAHVQRGDTLLAMRRVDEGIAELREGIRLKPDRAAAHASLARAYWLGQGRVDAAIAAFEETLRLNPEAGYTHLQLSLLYTLRGDYEAAEKLAHEAIRLQDQAMSGTTGLLVVGAHARLGYARYRQGHYDDAIREYRRELEMLSIGNHVLRQRTTIELQQKLGAAHRRKGDVASAQLHESQALELFDARLASGADEPFTRYYMAALHALRGDADAAHAHLRRPLAELPEFTRWRVPRDPDFELVRDHPLFKDLTQ